MDELKKLYTLWKWSWYNLIRISGWCLRVTLLLSRPVSALHSWCWVRGWRQLCQLCHRIFDQMQRKSTLISWTATMTRPRKKTLTNTIRNILLNVSLNSRSVTKLVRTGHQSIWEQLGAIYSTPTPKTPHSCGISIGNKVLKRNRCHLPPDTTVPSSSHALPHSEDVPGEPVIENPIDN